MTPEETEMMRWLLAWKRNWDTTGVPPVGTLTHVTYTDHGLYEAIRKYEAARVK